MASVVPVLDFDSLQREIDWLQRKRSRSETVSRAIQQLSAALEELRTAGEELDIQQEEMLRLVDELDRQRAHYREVFDLLPDACLITDAAGFVSDANSRAGALFGGASTAVLDTFVANLFDTSAAEEVAALARRGRGAITIQHGDRVLEVRAGRFESPVDRMVTAWVLRDTAVEFEGEDLGTEDVDVARSWLLVYGELIALTERAIDERPHPRKDAGGDALQERLNRLVQRRRAWRDRHAVLAGLIVDRERRLLTVGLNEVRLTRRETQLLTFLLQHPGVSFSAEALLNRAWLASFLSPEQLRTYVGRLRRKLEVAGAVCRLENVRGTGYRLVFD